MNRITVWVVFKAKAGHEDELKNTLRGMASEARNDKGCLRFDLVQNRQDPTRFAFNESWVSMKDLEDHRKMPYLSAYREKRAPLLDGEPEISFWTEIMR